MGEVFWHCIHIAADCKHAAYMIHWEDEQPSSIRAEGTQVAPCSNFPSGKYLGTTYISVEPLPYCDRDFNKNTEEISGLWG